MDYYINGVKCNFSPITSKGQFIKIVIQEWSDAVNAEAMIYGPGHPKYEEYAEMLKQRYMHNKMLADELENVLNRALSRYEQNKEE
jgi:hypothetical protein